MNAPVPLDLTPGELKAQVKQCWIDEVMAERHAPEAHDLRVRVGYHTAYWRWKSPPVEGLEGEHVVTFGTGLAQTADQPADRSEFLSAVLRHELAHAMFTERDLDAVSEACRAKRIPFRLLNLFEDARIEALYRARFKVAFEWGAHMKPPRTDTPLHMLMRLIHDEGEAPCECTGTLEVLERVKAYYRQIVESAHTMELVPLVEQWIQEFGGENMADLPHDLIEALKAMLEGADPDGESSVNDGDPPPASAIPAETTREAATSSADLFKTNSPNEITSEDEAIAERMAERMAREFVTPAGVVHSERPGRRVSARRLALDQDAIYRHAEDARPGKVKVAAVVDLSGSMSGEPSRMARIVCLAFSRLALAGKVSGTVTVTYAQGYETFKLPMRREDLERLEGFSSHEGLARAFRDLANPLSQADLVLCLTDGRITDGPVDVATLERRGIRCLGLYLGDDENQNLSQWFSRFLCRNTLQALVDEIGIRIRRCLK